MRWTKRRKSHVIILVSLNCFSTLLQNIIIMTVAIAPVSKAENSDREKSNSYTSCSVSSTTCSSSTNKNHHIYEDEYCFKQNSQTSLALQMMNYNSPKGSPSYNKMKYILSTSTQFYVSLSAQEDYGIFQNVKENLIRMLKGYGLQHITRSPFTAVATETSTRHSDPLLSRGIDKKEGKVLIITHDGIQQNALDQLLLQDNDKFTLMILQTEQVCCSHYGPYFLPTFKKCHESSNCIILEYSDQNLQWFRRAQQQAVGSSTSTSLQNSVILLPLLHQGRLDAHLSVETKKASAVEKELNDREWDVIFFGYMTPRRANIIQELEQQLQQQNNNNKDQSHFLLPPETKMKFEQVYGHETQYMAHMYQNSKICLVVHAFDTTTPGEYHRLSEMAPFGCIPMMESWGDRIGIDVYHQCGGVLFSSLEESTKLIAQVLSMLSKNNGNDDQQKNGNRHAEGEDSLLTILNQREKYIQWWKARVEWDKLLDMIFGDNSTFPNSYVISNDGTENYGSNQEIPSFEFE